MITGIPLVRAAIYLPDSSALSYDHYGPKRKDDGELERQDRRIKISRRPCWLFLRFFYFWRFEIERRDVHSEIFGLFHCLYLLVFST